MGFFKHGLVNITDSLISPDSGDDDWFESFLLMSASGNPAMMLRRLVFIFSSLKKVAPGNPSVRIVVPVLILSDGSDSQRVPAILQESA